MFDRRLAQNFDWPLLGITLALSFVGVVSLHSAVGAGVHSSPERILYLKQWIWYGAGWIAMTVCFSIDYKKIERWGVPIYALINLLLVAVLFFGRYVGGSRRWLGLGPISIQPSEMAKIAVIIILARYYARVVRSEGLTVRELILPFVFTAVPFALIVKQPDLGTAMMIFLIAATMTLYVKIERKTLICLSLIAVMVGGMGWFYLKDYQKQRIMTFINPGRDPLGAGYHIIQSRIAIGSGMLTGKGVLRGTQNTLSFLPEQHTDFIFSVFAEEWGFMGGILTHLLFLMLIIRGLNIAYNCKNIFGIVLSVGVTSVIFWQTFINLGMVMGLMPVVGMPLPLISYGGSSVLTIMICIGILMNVSMRRFIVD